MSTVWRSTLVSLAQRACPKAVEFYEQGRPYERGHFAVGIAAHACLERVVNATTERGEQLSQAEVDRLTLSVAEELIANGRFFEGAQEPPLSPDAAMQGRRLAIGFLTRWWPEPGAQAEVGVAVDRRWQIVPWDSEDAWLRAVLDYIAVEEHGEEESGGLAGVVHDHKTAWTADASELETVQRRIQVILAWLLLRERGVHKIVARVGNLRTGQVHEREFWLSDDGETLVAMQQEVAAVLDALDRQPVLGIRPASPGRCCGRCPYVLGCEWATDYAETAHVPGTAEKRAEAYAATHAYLQELSAMLRVDTAEQPIAVEGGVVGFVGQTRRRPTPAAYSDLWDRWVAGGGDARGLLRAMRLTSGNVQSAAVRLFPTDEATRDEKREAMEARAAWLAGALEEYKVPQFGVYNEQPEEEAQDG